MKLELISKKENSDTQNSVISKIRDLINYKNLEPGDKLPSERMLSNKFEVSRSNVREAIQKLEFYGLLNSVPQSGTFVANIGVVALNGIIEDILRLEKQDFKSLVETRILLELKSSALAASRRTDKDLEQIKETLDSFREKALSGEDAAQEDLLFHLAIAKASKNSTINTFMLIINPEIIINFEKHHVYQKGQAFSRIKEHEEIFEAIKIQNAELAKDKMKIHFKTLYEYCNNTAS